MRARLFDREADLLATVESDAKVAVARDTRRAFVRDALADDWIQLVSASDPRLSDPRPPIGHGHPKSQVTGLVDDLASLAVDVAGRQPLSEKGQPGGYLDLGVDAKVPQGRLADRLAGIAPVRMRLATNFTNGTTTPETIFELEFAAGKTYSLELVLFTQVPLSSGIRLECVFGGTATNARGLAVIASAATTYTSIGVTGFPMVFTTSTGPGTSTPTVTRVNADFEVGTSGGTLTVTAASTLDGAQVKAFRGSYALLYTT